MKCKLILDGDFFEAAPFRDYAVSYDEKYNIIHMEFDSEEAPEIWDKAGWQPLYDKGVRFNVIDEKGNLRKLSPEGVGGEIMKRNFDYAKTYRRMCRYKQKVKDTDALIEGRVEKFGKSGIHKGEVPLGKYKSYTYVDSENKFAFPYRFKASGSSTAQPLVVYFHGAGALGFDNLKPLFEYLPIGKRLKTYNASILIPQAPKYSNVMLHNSMLDKFYKSTVKLIGELCRDEAVDPRRIYLIGTSFGGCCVWQMLWDNPGMFACGVPVMGLLNPYYMNKTVSLDRLKSVPIWIAHSSDDDNVPIVSDDFCFEQLKHLNAPVKYTRLEKYGHTMQRHFYREENYAEWMFSQRLP